MDEGALASELVLGKALECLRAEATVFVDEIGAGLNDASKLVLGDAKPHLFRGRGQDDRIHEPGEGLAVEVAVGADLIVRITQLLA